MLSNYFKVKTSDIDFKNRLEDLFKELSNKKVLIYGAGEGFQTLNDIYKFSEKFDIVGISDKKFTDSNENFLNIKTIPPIDINNYNFDIILVSNENYLPIVNYLTSELNISLENIRTIFEEEFKEERININYLYEHKFNKTLPKLLKKLKNKKVVFYGAGAYLGLIKKYYDISSIDVIGIADKKYEIYKSENEFLGYKTLSPSEIKDLNPDYVIVTTKKYISIIEDLYYDILQNCKIKIKPLVKKSLLTLVKEIWKL